MGYSEMLKKAVQESGWSYTEIIRRCELNGVKITKSYLSKLCNGKKPPASDRVNKVLVKVLSPAADINYDDLRLAAYKEIIPSDILRALKKEA